MEDEDRYISRGKIRPVSSLAKEKQLEGNYAIINVSIQEEGQYFFSISQIAKDTSYKNSRFLLANKQSNGLLIHMKGTTGEE